MIDDLCLLNDDFVTDAKEKCIVVDVSIGSTHDWKEVPGFLLNKSLILLSLIQWLVTV